MEANSLDSIMADIELDKKSQPVRNPMVVNGEGEQQKRGNNQEPATFKNQQHHQQQKD